jgi:stress response protein SCP2
MGKEEEVGKQTLAKLYLEPPKPPTAAEIDAAVCPLIGHEDMTKMEDMNEETLLENVKLRYDNDLIYTYTSAILIALNPYKYLPVYTQAWVKKYVGKRLGILSPHLYAVAESSYSYMVDRKLNVSVLISGESGAGKTEATKLILRFLAARMDKVSKVETMLLETVPVLEALGNAKTVRNDNSSRFGKYIEIIFDNNNFICGSKITTYLLEKSRLCRQAEGERNFHIFYQITEGTNAEEKQKYLIKPTLSYKYLNQSGCIAIPGLKEDEELKQLKSSYKLFEISTSTTETIFSILSGILHLGNLFFKESSGLAQLEQKSEESLTCASTLFKLKKEDILAGVRTKVLYVRGERVVVELNATQSRDASDALAKAMYSKLFDWMVAKLNESLFVDKYTLRNFIGVLDIFGFENFKFNTLEQFLINLANEKLQKFFNHHIFSMEQEEYEKEKINWKNITFKDNQECLDLIEKKPIGILSFLDEECKFPKASDSTFLQKINTNFEKHAYYEKLKIVRSTFKIRHYAGVVEYDVTGWLDKNKDELPEHMLGILRGCSVPLISGFFNTEVVKGEGEGGDRSPRGGPSSKSAEQKKENKITVGGFFKNSLQALTDLMLSTHPFFVRCIKPNMFKASDNFNSEEVQAQLRYAGMLETIRIRRLGYPIRYQFKEFYQRYKCLVHSSHMGTGAIESRVDGMLPHLKLTDGQWQKGLTKVFLKQEAANDLEDRRVAKLSETILVAQNWWRMIRLRKKFKMLHLHSGLVQTWWRARHCRKGWLKAKWAAIKIQSYWRMIRAIRLRKKLVEEKRKKEEEKRRKKEEERQKRIARGELAQVLKEEEEEKRRQKEELQEYLKKGKKKERKLRKEEKEKLKQQELLDAGPAPEIQVDTTIYCPALTHLGLKWSAEKIVDLDLSAVVFDKNGNVVDSCFYNNLNTTDKAIQLDRDDRLGEAQGGKDNESIFIDFSKLNPISRFISVLVTCYSDGYSFKDTQSAVLDIKDRSSGASVYSYKVQDPAVKDDKKITGAIIGYLAKSGDKWIVKPTEQKVAGTHWLDILPTLYRNLENEKLVPKADLAERNLPKNFRSIKGEEIVIAPSITKLMCGLGWKGSEDLDLSVLTFRYKEYIDHVDPVRHRQSKDGAIFHKGDSKSGKGTDDERIFVDLESISSRVNTLVFLVTVFNAAEGGGFAKVKDAHVRLVDATSSASVHDEGKELCRYALSRSCGNRTAQIMCKLYRVGPSRWNVLAMGEPSSGLFYEHLIPKVQPCLDPSPPTRTFQVTIHSGKNIPADKFEPYFRVKFDRDAAKSKVLKKASSKWDEVLIVTGEANFLEVTIYNHKIGKDKFFGRITAPVESEFKKKFFPLEDRGKKKEKVVEGAEIRLSVANITGTPAAAAALASDKGKKKSTKK